MIPLTIHMLTKNNEETIETAINSIINLECNIVAIDLGSTDNTVAICKNCGINVFTKKYEHRNVIRNKFVQECQNEWNMYLEPWETLVSGEDNVIQAVAIGPKQPYYLQIIQEDVLSKEIRLWNKHSKLTFDQPVYETLSCKTAQHLNCMIFSTPPNASEERLRAVLKWKEERPAQNETCYYQAFALLEQKKYKEFMGAADEYLFRETKPQKPVAMIRYYKAMVYCYFLKDAESAIKNLLVSLAINPLMAEFWCLLGDIYYHLIKKFNKAMAFYENAIVLGSRRLKTDTWPLQMSRYQDYPESMINSCKDIIKQARLIGVPVSGQY